MVAVFVCAPWYQPGKCTALVGAQAWAAAETLALYGWNQDKGKAQRCRIPCRTRLTQPRMEPGNSPSPNPNA